MDFKSLIKQLSLVALLALCALGLGIFIAKYQPGNQISTQTATTEVASQAPVENPQVYYAEQLAQEETDAWKAIEQEYGISKAEFQQKYNEYLPEYNESIKELETGIPAPQDIQNLIESLCKEINLSTDSFITQLVDPKTCTEATHSPACANDKHLNISLDFFNKLDPEAKRHCSLHEMQHIIYKDNSKKAVLRRIMDEKNIKYDQKDPNTAYNKLSRFMERRADLYPALINIDHAQDHKIYMEKMFARRGETSGITHPKNSERLAISQEIYSMMNQVDGKELI